MKAPTHHQSPEEVYLAIDKISYLLNYCLISCLTLSFSLPFNNHLSPNQNSIEPSHSITVYLSHSITVYLSIIDLASLTMYLVTIPTLFFLISIYLPELHTTRALNYKLFYANNRKQSIYEYLSSKPTIVTSLPLSKIKFNIPKHNYFKTILQVPQIAQDKKFKDTHYIKNG